jgi:DNA polymerase I-like protein with 3'-5' exonuclease and polymerase domains
MFIADPGWTFVEPDLAQAEDRVVCVLATDWQALESYKRTKFNYNKHGLKDDKHTLTAIAVTGLGFESITDWERQAGKKTRHAGNYNIKKHQHMLLLGKSGIFISEYIAGKQLDRFHDSNPLIRGVFHSDIEEALRINNCRLVTPHGRARTFYNKWGEDLLKEAYAFIPQATVSDQTKFAMVKIKRSLGSNIQYCMESHDSFLALVRDSYLSQSYSIIKESFEEPISFRNCSLSRDYDLVIPCDIKIGKRWIDKSDKFLDGMEKIKI